VKGVLGDWHAYFDSVRPLRQAADGSSADHPAPDPFGQWPGVALNRRQNAA
jgi:hypothetical protein